MKRLLLFILLVYTMLEASSNYELTLYEQVLPSIFKTLPIEVYVDGNIRKLLQHSDKFKIVDSCGDNTIVIIGQDFVDLDENNCQDKPIFATSYPEFKNNQHSFGAFYWRKGRPQLRFHKNILKQYNLTLPKGLEKYAK